MQLYKEFLNRVIPHESKDRKREELNLDATLWHYERGIGQFLRENERKLNSHKILEKLRKEWEMLRSMNTKLGKIDVKEKKLCKLQEFVEKRLRKHKELVYNDVWIEKLAKSEFIASFSLNKILFINFRKNLPSSTQSVPKNAKKRNSDRNY